jgi:TRAP-type C4-dicarboxylate transport system substrate-binding protein
MQVFNHFLKGASLMLDFTKKAKRAVSFMAICAIAIGGMATEGNAASNKLRLKVASQYAKDHPATKALGEFKERVEKETDGRIKVRLFPANQLGDYTQVYEELRRGTIDMGLISVPSQFDTRLEVTYLHYLAMNYDEARKIYAEGSMLFKTMDKLHNALDVKFLGFNIEGFGGLGLTKKPTNMSDASADKGILLRVPPMAVFKDTADDQGFKTVSVPFAELYTALQTGVADGWSGGPALVNYLQFRDVIKYFVVVNNFVESTSYMMSDKIWQKLSADDQKIIQSAVSDLQAKSFDISEANDKKALDQLKEAGIEVVVLSDEELKAWADNCRNVTWPKLEERLSKEMLDALKSQY